jgi:group I intron endonuclease
MRIYKITNIITGNFYIGKTVSSLEKRFYHHKYAASKYKNKTHLWLSMNKYGHDNFIIEEVCTALSENELNSLEVFHIATMKPYYNKAPGGKGGRHKGFNLTDEHKTNISKALSGKKLSQDHINKAAYARSKDYQFVDPNGNIIQVKNLSEFCRINKLNQSHMVSVSIGRHGFKSHKGYRKGPLEG